MTTEPSTTGEPRPLAGPLAGPLAVQVAVQVELSHDLIARHQHPGGAYPAAPGFSAYDGFAWLRDGSFVAEGMSRHGDLASVGAFHDWVSRAVLARRERVRSVVAAREAGRAPEPADLLPARFTLEGADGADGWWDFQVDGYGMWLWAVVTHSERHGTGLARWADAIAVTVDYLVAAGDLPCYDWWEEHGDKVHPSTLAAVRAGLLAAVSGGTLDQARTVRAVNAADRFAATALRDGVTSGRASEPARRHLAKWLGAQEVDASLAACVVPFGLVPVGSELATATLDAIVRDLDDGDGVHRFRADVFYGGGRWPLLSCLLGWNLLAAGDRAGAERLLAWALGTAGPDGHLPEQVSDRLLHPDTLDEWVERWGPVASPLLWSHGMVLVLAHALEQGA